LAEQASVCRVLESAWPNLRTPVPALGLGSSASGPKPRVAAEED
jgi:hypothetical protein